MSHACPSVTFRYVNRQIVGFVMTRTFEKSGRTGLCGRTDCEKAGLCDATYFTEIAYRLIDEVRGLRAGY